MLFTVTELFLYKYWHSDEEDVFLKKALKTESTKIYENSETLMCFKALGRQFGHEILIQQ